MDRDLSVLKQDFGGWGMARLASGVVGLEQFLGLTVTLFAVACFVLPVIMIGARFRTPASRPKR
jgi:hypothetical protein